VDSPRGPWYGKGSSEEVLHGAKEARKRERQERAQTGEADDDIDWSQAVGISPPPGAVADKADETGAEDEDEDEEEAEK